MKILLTLLLGFFTLAGIAQITFEEDAYGNTVATDQYGNVISTYKENAYGEIIREDEYGREIGRYEKDAYGNTVYYPAEGGNSGSGMYQVKPPQIKTGVGVGGAQVFPQSKADYSGVGYSIGRRAAERRSEYSEKDLKEYIERFPLEVKGGKKYKVPEGEYWLVKTAELYYKTAAVVLINDTSLSAKEDVEGGLLMALEEDVVFGGVGKEFGEATSEYVPIKSNFAMFTKPMTVYRIKD